jgi:hypothetical protein
MNRNRLDGEPYNSRKRAQGRHRGDHLDEFAAAEKLEQISGMLMPESLRALKKRGDPVHRIEREGRSERVRFEHDRRVTWAFCDRGPASFFGHQ